MIEVEVHNTDVEVVSEIGVESTGNVTAEVVDLGDLDITVAKKEYVITGDSIYVPVLYEDAPQWMKDLVSLTVDVSIETANASTLAQLSSVLATFATSYVPLNQYTQSINSLALADTNMQAVVETLNSNFNDGLNLANSQIINLQTTKASKTEVVTQVINTLAAQLTTPGSDIGAVIASINQAIVNETTARANSLNVLNTSLSNIGENVAGNASAIHSLNTYVGVENGISNGVGLLADVKILQKQNDGVIETVTGTYDVMLNPQDPNLAELVLTAEPYASWRAADVTGIDTRLKHIGDVYIKYTVTSNGAREYIGSYKFIRTVVDVTDAHHSTDADGFTWALIIDQASQDAYTQALNAYDLADNKRRVFVSTPAVPYDIGDLWLVQTGATIIGTTQSGRLIQSGDTLRCCETKTKTGLYEHNDWIPADSYREGMNAIQTDLNNWRTGTYAPFVANIQSQVDKKSETFYQATVPTGRIKSTNIADNSVLNAYIGDLWKNTYIGTISGYLGDNTEYVYTKTANGSNWNYDWTKMEVPDIVFDTIDTKKSIYSGNSVPVAIAPDIIEINDMWITGSSVVSGYDKESIYVWSGSAWVKPLKYTDDTATVALQTGLADGTVTVKLTNAYVGTTPFLTYITNEIDSKVGVYSGETAPVTGQPSGVAINDIYLWFTTASKVLANGTTQVYDITRTYKYSGSMWNEITTDSNITALADLADGKRTVFSGNTVPVEAVARDIWIPSATNGTYLQGEIYQYSGSAWIVATKYSADLEAVRNNLQSQVDGKVDTYYQGTVPTGMTALNNGDYWYCTADISTYKKGKVYKYVHATTSWVETADVSRYAFDTADGKASIFTSTNAPTTGYKINDMLIVIGSFNNGTTTFSDGVVLSSSANRVSGFTASDWVKKINDTEDLDAFVSVTYTPTVTSLQNQVDGKIESWYTASTSDPKSAWTDAPTRAKHDGDMWYQTDTKLSYYYSSSTNSWNLIDDAKAIQALTNAAAAQTSANSAQTSANTANSLLADIASDNKLVPFEKVAVKKEWDIIQSEYTKNLAQGNVYGVSTSSYISVYNSLSGYITPLLSSLTTTSDIVGTTFRSMFKAYYDANVDLLNAVANKINAIADGKITSYYIDTFSSLQALSNGWTTAEKTSNVGDLATVWNDSTLDNNGTWRWNGTSWVTTRDKKLVALASDVTALSTELDNGTNTWASADSTLENSLMTEISDEGARVESKFAYNSVVGINGVYKKSGFGLTTNYVSGSGTQVDPYVSEFWIDASRFKFTNSNATGSVAPFTIDASGATPQIAFNGIVNFSNVTNTTGTGSNLLYNSAPKIGSETKGWYVWTNSGMTVNLSAGFDIWKPTGGASVAANIGGNPSIGSVYDVGQSSRFSVIAGSRYEASAYISAHRSNSYILLVFYDTAGNHAGEYSGNVINYAGSSALVNWGRSSVFTTAPGNAATATLIIRSVVTGSNPYCFVTNAFTGVAEANQTTPSNWSEGTSAGATYTSELSNDSGFTTLGAVASQGYVLPAGVANAINTNTTTISGSKITTGSITAAQIRVDSISADRLSSSNGSSTTWTGGGLVSQNFNGNVSGDIGSPTSGFRLSSNAAGTSADPNIYGAYIQGSSVEVNSFKVRAEGYPNNFGGLNLVSGSTAIVGSGYSSGFDNRRVCSASGSSIKLDCWARATGNWIAAVLEYEANSSGNWIVIADRGMSMYGYSEYAYLNFAEFFNPSLVPVTGYVHFRIRLTSGNSGSTSGVVVTLSNG